MKALLLDADPEIQKTVNLAFKFSWPNLEIISSTEGSEALEITEKETPDVIFVNGSLPDMDGCEFINHLREFSDTPLIILSDPEDEAYVVRGLEAGADAYVNKPLRVLELLARTRAVIRRSMGFSGETSNLPPFVSSRLAIDFATREVLVDGSQVCLTPTEYRLLSALARNAGCLLTMQMLKQQVWQDDEFVDSSTVRKCICQLRRKLGDESGKENIVINERGIGYKIAKN